VYAVLDYLDENIPHPAQESVINLSISATLPSVTLDTMTRDLINLGVTVVAAAGNDGVTIGDKGDVWPSTSPAICVGATDKNDMIAIWDIKHKWYVSSDRTMPRGSNHGPRIDLWAPAELLGYRSGLATAPFDITPEGRASPGKLTGLPSGVISVSSTPLSRTKTVIP
jgi:hypothetical protein